MALSVYLQPDLNRELKNMVSEHTRQYVWALMSWENSLENTWKAAHVNATMSLKALLLEICVRYALRASVSRNKRRQQTSCAICLKTHTRVTVVKKYLPWTMLYGDWSGLHFWWNSIQLAAKLLDPLEFLLLDPMLNKSCNIERCGYRIHQIVANMTLSLYLEVELSLLCEVIVSGYLPLF